MRASRLIAAILLVAAPSLAKAEGVPRDFWGSPAMPDVSDADRMSVEEAQSLLLWTGFYSGRIDGREDEAYRTAVERFQSSLGDPSGGTLSRTQQRTLRARAERAREQADFQVVHDEWTGISAPLPMGYLSPPRLGKSDEKFTVVSYDALGSSDFSVRFERWEDMNFSAKAIYEYLMKTFREDEDNKNVSGTTKGDYFLITMERGSNSQIRIYRVNKGEVRGVVIGHATSRRNIFAPVQMQIFSGVDHFKSGGFDYGTRGAKTRRGEYPGYADFPDWYRTLRGNGSGSIVTYKGHILTNHHVVDGCARLTVNGNSAVLIGVDIVNDLALLRSDTFAERAPVRFRENDAQLGEDIVVIGYPVWNTSQALNFTTGVVSARSGLRGDRRNIQITAPVQPGNSGGPVLDSKGQQIAVVVTKATTTFQTRSNVENMAWVIRSNVALDFLEDLGVTPIMADRKPEATDWLAEVASSARRFTVRVECHRS